MKVVLLAGGLGTRISEESHLKPKPMWGNIVGWVVSVANAFFWSNRYVFRNEDNSAAAIAKRILKTYLTYGSTFLLATLLLYLEVQVWDISEWIAPLINLLITIPLNFFLNKLWAFKK